jgi:hypothetical protein
MVNFFRNIIASGYLIYNPGPVVLDLFSFSMIIMYYIYQSVTVLTGSPMGMNGMDLV